MATLQPEVREHEPIGALNGGDDGLAVIRRIAEESPNFIAPGGWLLMEFSDGQGRAVRELFSGAPWTDLTIEKDFSRRERILIARARIS
jgi:release factor glutamine methyltransferase